MPTLSSLIVQREIATMRAVEEAISRQVIHGGDLPTNLLELGAVDEKALTWILAESFGLEPAPVGSLPMPDPAAIRMVPGDMALRHGLFPLSLKNRTLVVAIAEPMSPAVEEDLSFALDVNIRQLACPLVRVREAIAAHYGMPLDRRLLRLVERLEAGLATRPSSAPPPAAGMGSFELPRPSSMPPSTFASGVGASAIPAAPRAVRVEMTPDLGDVIPGPPPPPPEESPLPPPSRNARQMAGWLMRTAVDERRARARPKRRKGPFPRVDAEAALEEADSTDAVLDVFLAFAAQYFEYAATFVVHDDLAEGRDALGGGAEREKVLTLGVPLEFPSVLSTARARRAAVVERVQADTLDAELLTDLGRLPGDARNKGAIAVVPVVVRGRAVALLMGDDGPADVTFDGIGDVIVFAGKVTAAIERIILAKKAGRRPVRASVPPPAPSRPPKDPRVGAGVLADALRLPTGGAGAAALAPDASSAEVSPEAASVKVDSTGGGGAVPVPVTPAGASDVKVSPAARTDVPPNLPPMRSVEDTLPGWAAHTELAAPVVRPEHHWQELPSSERFAYKPPPAGTLSVRPMSERPIPREETPDNEGEGAVILLAGSTPSPSPTSARYEGRSPTSSAPPTRASSRGGGAGQSPEPSEATNDPRVLLHEAARGGAEGEAAFARLMMLAESSMKTLMALFPGPLAVDRYRSRDDLPPASQCGPLLELMTVVGRPALAQMTVKSASSDPDQRFWATHVLGELRYPEASSALIARLFDDDPSVRRVARRSAAALVTAGEPGDPLLRFLDDMTRNPDEPVHRRVMAIDTMGEMRNARVVPALIAVLDDPHVELKDAARRALMLVTRQDFGTDTARWIEWWSERGGSDRIEWLIDALMHGDPGLRRAAGDELKAITKEYFGYYDDLPPRERERAQVRYREWWEEEGRARFSTE